MKKLTAFSLCLVLILSLCACGAREDLSGTWTANLNMASYYNAELQNTDPTIAEFLTLDSFDMPIIMDLKADGTYTMSVDRAAMESILADVLDKTRAGLEAYLADLLAQQGIEMDVNDALAAMGISMDDLLAEMTAQFTSDEFYDSQFVEGCWKAEDGKFFSTDSLDAPVVTTGEYNTYVLDGNTLSIDIGTETLDNDLDKMMFPMVLTRVE